MTNTPASVQDRAAVADGAADVPVDLPVRRCPRSRRGPKQTVHEPHPWVGGEYWVIGDEGYHATCPGFPLPT